MNRKTFLSLALSLALVTPALAQDENAFYYSGFERYRVETLLEDLNLPWGLGFLPDGTALLTERTPASILHVNFETGERTPLEGLPEVYDDGDAGMRDIIIHPDYENNGWIYFSYSVGSDEGSTLVVDRAKLDGNRLVDRENILTLDPLATWDLHFYHYGARLVLNDGYLFVSVGDRHNRYLAQDLSVLNGSIIRLNEDGSVPDDNPFVATEGIRPEIWSYGHRNPQGLAINPATGALWSTEHGPLAGDELNLIEAGKNYGWPVITYGREYDFEIIGDGLTHKEGMEQPKFYYRISLAPTDLMFYSGDVFKDWKGSAFFGGIGRAPHLHRVVIQDGHVIYDEEMLGDLNLQFRFIRQGPDGLLYLGTDEGTLLRIVPDNE